MIASLSADHIASQLLRLEQQLKAYEKLHAGELTELWQTLNDCKRAIAAIVSSEPLSSVEPDDSEETVPNPANLPGDHPS